MDIVLGKDTLTQVQILHDTICISHSSNTLANGMNSIILSFTMSK